MLTGSVSSAPAATSITFAPPQRAAASAETRSIGGSATSSLASVGVTTWVVTPSGKLSVHCRWASLGSSVSSGRIARSGLNRQISSRPLGNG